MGDARKARRRRCDRCRNVVVLTAAELAAHVATCDQLPAVPRVEPEGRPVLITSHSLAGLPPDLALAVLLARRRSAFR